MSSCMKVTFVGHGPGGEQLVLTHFLANDSVAENDFVSTGNADTLFATLMGVLIPFMCGAASYTHDKTVLAEVSNVTGPFSVESFTNAGVTNTGISAPANIALAAVMNKHTLLAGRKGRGRLFIPFPAASYFSINGVANYSTYGALSDITDAWSTGISLNGLESTATFEPVIFHRGLFTWTPIVNCSFSTKMGVQRRRRLGVGA